MIILYLRAPYQTSYTITTDCDALAALLSQYYGSYITQTGTTADCGITVSKKADTYILKIGTKTRQTAHPLSDINYYLTENAVYDEAVFALHGSALAYNAHAYLFLAATTSGKSTLASYLTSQGFGYITDDCILLDRHDFRIHPYRTPLHLRDGGLEVLRQYNAVPDTLQTVQEGSSRRHVYTPRNCVTEALPLGGIYFITRTQAENRLAVMTANERMMELLRAPITNYKMTRDYIKFVAKLVNEPCQRLYYSDMTYVAEVIRRG